jgi:diamine N-acetyltransferase
MRLVIEAKALGKPVGSIDLFDIDPYNRRAGVGIVIHDKDYEGQGFASSALQALIRYCFHYLGLNQLYCNILSNNPQSLNLFRSKNFSVVGIKKEWVRTTSDWLDEYMLQLINPLK